MGKLRKRMSFSRINEGLEMPDLIEVQKRSYQRFLETDLKEVLADASPITNYNGNLELTFTDYSLGEPKNSVERCRERDMTYAAPLNIHVHLYDSETSEIKETDVYMGDFPLMTENGTFVINGADRVIVSQLVRSPGVYYGMHHDPAGKKLFDSTVIPNRGAWLEYDTDSADVFSVRIDKNRKLPITCLIRALGLKTDQEILERFGDDRRTEIETVTGEVDIEDLIAEEQCVYTLTEAGYIKRQLKATYQAQKRGGRGISGMTRKEEDIVQEMFVGSTHDYVLFVTDKGRLFRIKGYTIAEGSRTSKGSNIVNLLQLAEGEKVTNMICQSKEADTEGGFVTMVTKQGLIKRTPLEQYANIRKTGLIGIALNEGDALAWTRLTTGNDMLIVATRNGQAIRFNEADARPMGRSGHGVRAIKLAEGDEVVGVCICREGGTVLTVTENGKGRRSDIDTYRITARGGKGIRNYDASKDKVAAVKIVDDVDDVLLSSQEGIIIRLHANEIPVQSRYGSGVRVMRLGENDKVMVLARTDHDDEAQTETVEAEEGDEPTAEQLAAMEAADEASASEAPAED